MLQSLFQRVDRLAARIGRILMRIGAIAILLMIVAIIVQVAASRAGVTTIYDIDGDWPLFGSAITLNSMTDLQWYLLALVALVPAGVVWLRDGHVRVDFAYSRLAPRGKAVIDLLGHLVFALPFLAYMIPDAWELGMKSFARGEASPNGGLIDRYLPRMAMPVCFALLLCAIVFEAWRVIRSLRVARGGGRADD